MIGGDDERKGEQEEGMEKKEVKEQRAWHHLDDCGPHTDEDA